MMDSNVIEELLLHDEDFPKNYVNMRHPEDYIIFAEFKPQFICHSYFGRHNRLIARVAWKVSDNVMIPMSFVCDTGAPSHLYLSTEAMEVLNNAKLLLTDDKGTPYMKMHKNASETFPATVEETPYVHKHANILGLKALKQLSLHLSGEAFNFNSEFAYF